MIFRDSGVHHQDCTMQELVYKTAVRIASLNLFPAKTN